MDDKTLNLWRQIESGRREGRGQTPSPTKPAASPAQQSDEG